MRTAHFHTFLIIFTNSVEHILNLRNIEKFYFYSHPTTFIRFLDTLFLWLYLFYLLQFFGKSLTFRIILLILFFFYYIHYLDNFYSGGEIQGLSGQTAISVSLLIFFNFSSVRNNLTEIAVWPDRPWISPPG